MIYALLLEQGKVYVGFTQRMNEERFLEHFSGEGSQWTQLYKPIKVIEYREGTLYDERALTLNYMKKYGWRNVRGSVYCKVEMDNPPKELSSSILSKVSLPTLSNRGYSRYTPNSNNKKRSTVGNCYRCGRKGHWSPSCYATTDSDGNYL